MLRRFLAKRPEFSAEAASPEAKLRLLRRLLLESLTSKKGYPGAGFGLERALTAIRALNGFVTLRTDSFWLYSSFADAQAAESPLQEVLSSTQLARVAGTHFNALIPLREP